MQKDIVLLDLFSGIGGFSKGLSEAGFNIVKHYYSEIDKYAIAVYGYQFKNAEYVGSVTTLDGRTITRPNIITFGSPCQNFSLAGKREGLKGEKSSLIKHAIRLVAECRPDVFIWENVKGVFSTSDGADFWGVIKAFADIGGYRLEWQLLNTSWFLPQNRERIYLIGHLAETGRSFREVFPFRESDLEFSEKQGRSTEGEIASCLQSPGHACGNYKGMNVIDVIQKTSGQSVTYNIDKTGCLQAGGANVMDKVPNVVVGTLRTHNDGKGFRKVKSDNAPAIPARAREDGSGQPVVMICDSGLHRQPQEREIAPPLRANTGAGHGNYIKSKRPRVNPNTVVDPEDISPTITATNCSKNADCQPWIEDKNRIRRLTEIECEKLQGFPADWTKYGLFKDRPTRKDLIFREKYPELWAYHTKAVNVEEVVLREIASTQRYKMCGNAVTVAVVKAIGQRLIEL